MEASFMYDTANCAQLVNTGDCSHLLATDGAEISPCGKRRHAPG
jgi:hypothetical protein